MEHGIAERLAVFDAVAEGAEKVAEAARGIACEEFEGIRQGGAGPDEAGEAVVKLPLFPNGKPMHGLKIVVLTKKRKG